MPVLIICIRERKRDVECCQVYWHIHLSRPIDNKRAIILLVNTGSYLAMLSVYCRYYR